MSGWTRTRPRRSYSAEYYRNRPIVLAEESVCRLCGRAPSTVVDHIIGVAAGGSDDRSNLQGACYPCNQRKASAIESKPVAQRKRPPERHPGMV